MKIKLAVLERDKSYLSRIVSVFGTKYADRLEMYSFTDMDIAIATVKNSRIDVLLSSDAFDIDFSEMPNRCAFAYLVDALGIDTLNGQRAICKFQKADLIYKQILSAYSEKASSITGFSMTGDESSIIGFCSASGGTGSSSMAAACAVYYANKEKKVLYLNLEKFGAADVFFSGPGQFDMSDIIFALKSKKANLPLKLESCVRQDESGVFFYAPSKIALDMMELTVEDVIRLISDLKLTGGYDYIILDMDFSLEKEMLQLYRQARAIVWVGDGSGISNNKITKAYNALTILEQNNDAPLTERICLIYNKFSNKSSETVGDIGIKSIGGAPRYDHASAAQVIEQLVKFELFGKIL